MSGETDAANTESVAHLKAHRLLALVGRQPPHGAASALGQGDPSPHTVLAHRVYEVLRFEPARETTRAIEYVVCVKLDLVAVVW